MAAQSSPHTADFGDTEGHTRPFVHTDTLTEKQAARIERSHSLADAVIGTLCVLALAWVAIGAPA
ncbi:hypothetical protein [Methylibium petroleiphilum]